MFFFLHLMLDVYSRKIVAHEVHETESAEHAAALVKRAVMREGVSRGVLVVHQDNGSPMFELVADMLLADQIRVALFSLPESAIGRSIHRVADRISCTVSDVEPYM